MALSRKLTYLVLVLMSSALIAAGCAGPKPTTTAPAAKPISIVAFYPLNKDHKYIADYLVALGKRYPGKVTVEVNDMQSEAGRRKWRTSGLSCAGVFVNGKTRWAVLRDGKQENVDFLKRMGSFWEKDDFEAVVKQLVEDPSKTPVVPSAKGKPKSKPAAGGEGEGAGAATPAAGKPAAPAGK